MDSNALDWRAVMRLAPDPYCASGDRWVGSLPAHVDWTRLDDRLIARGWYPKNAIARLRVYGCDGGHEIVIEPASRQVLIRLGCAPGTSEMECASIAERLAQLVAEEAIAPSSRAA
jgi:hypothetical protein